MKYSLKSNVDLTQSSIWQLNVHAISCDNQNKFKFNEQRKSDDEIALRKSEKMV